MKPTVFNSLYKQKSITFLEDFFTKKQKELAVINTWGVDITDKLGKFITQGKMLRGSLVLFIYEAYTGKISDDAIQLAVALELLHSSLLIHDDIMDNDMLRRGQQTIFAQYQTFAESKLFLQTRHFGESMGICAGDIGFFLAIQLLSGIKNQKITNLCMQEIVYVVLAQMQDVYSGYTQDLPNELAIENVYRYKTGRYTFALPMMLGALLARQNKDTVQQFEKSGEDLGLLFQLKDDQLSLFGKQEVTGKPEGSDIRENKKTLYRLYLFEKASFMEKERLGKIFGKQEITAEELAYVRTCIHTLHIQERIDKRMQTLQNSAKALIMQVEIAQEYKEALMELLGYIVEREK